MAGCSENKTTIVYYTDNSLDAELMRFCHAKLLEAANGKRIISVSQQPLNFGDNICVGDIGRSHLSLFKQILAGVEQVQTEFLALAEHDCLYTPEHFDWKPPTDDLFYYNVNHYFVQWSGSEIDGLYSYHRRKVLSMMIADTALTIKAAREKVVMIEAGAEIAKGQPGACEFGVCDNRQAYTDFIKVLKDFGKEVGCYRAAAFRTITPQLDIRHRSNFSGMRRGKDRRYDLDYWGDFKKVYEKWQTSE